jgi:uncharacterized protein
MNTNTQKTTVIYHSADFDGLFCREIARKFLPDAELIGWDWGQPLIPFPSDGLVYILDLSPDCLAETSTDNIDRIIWIDHHKSAIDKWASTMRGYRIDGVAACRLAWQWFIRAAVDNTKAHYDDTLPQKQAYIDRTVSEPYAVQLAGEYDIWDKRDPDAEVFQLGLRSKDLTSNDWKAMLETADDPNMKSLTGECVSVSEQHCRYLLQAGHVLQRYQREQDAFAMNNSFLVEFEGLKFLALNTQAKSSLAFKSKDVPETGHEALLKFCWNGSVWDCSMYHAKHRTDLDLSTIAVRHGGGGHRGACGMRLKKLPFIP